MILSLGIFALLYATLTLKPDLLMSLCAVLALVTLYQFSSEQKTLFNRRTRAFEPDFKGQEKEFIGPAQSMLKKDKGGISARSGKGTEIWEKVKSIFFAIAVAVIFLIYTGLDESVSRMAAGMGSRGLPMGVTLVVLCLMAVHTGRRMQKEKDGPRWPRLLACLACAAGAISLITGQVEDLIYYGCAAAMLLATIIELVIMNRAHNEYASRPVPFFDGKEEAA